MSTELIAVIIGGAIGTIGSLGTTLLLDILKNKRRAKSIGSIAAAEITAVKEKAQRYLNGKSDLAELAASTPMLTSIVSEIGYLSSKQVIAFRRVVTLDMEMRKAGNKDKATLTVEACNEALSNLPISK